MKIVVEVIKGEAVYDAFSGLLMQTNRPLARIEELVLGSKKANFMKSFKGQTSLTVTLDSGTLSVLGGEINAGSSMVITVSSESGAKPLIGGEDVIFKITAI